MDILKSKLNLKSGKQVLIITASFVAALVTIYVAYTSIARRNISLQRPDSEIGAANPSCLLNLTLNKPSPSPTPIACVDDTEIALVIDRSSTMTDTEADGREKLEWAKEAAVGFVNAVAASGRTNIRISVTSFGSQGNSGDRADGLEYDSTLHIGLSNNYTAVKTAINSINYQHSGTCIQCGIRIGNGSLLVPGAAVPKFVILLSDGMANHIWNGTTSNATSLAIAEANTGRTNGIVYYSIGYGVGSQISPSTLISIAGSSANYTYKPDVNGWAGAFLDVLSSICGGTKSSPTPSPKAKTPTPSPKAKTPTPSPKPLATKTPTPAPVACTNWGVNEKSGTGSTIVKIDAALASSTAVKQHLCSSGYCEIESMDYDTNRGILFVVPNVAPTKGLYKVNTDDGTISLYKAFSPSFQVNGLSFKKTDSSKAWLWRNGYGLYSMNMDSGAVTLELSYKTNTGFESIEWDATGRYLYASRNTQLWRYDSQAATKTIAVYASNLPGKTDSMDFAPSSYLNGMLVAYGEAGYNYYTYNVATKTVIKKYPKIGYNGDALGVCIPN